MADIPESTKSDVMWLNAETCIENAEIAYEDSTEDEDGPVDTVISSGDLGVLIDLARYAVATRAAPPAMDREAVDFLHRLRRVNTDRYEAWIEGADAGIMFDALELGGEVGELLNVVKKLEREDRGWRGSRADPADFADECADVLICLDKLARRRGVDLIAATIAKFNATSDKVGLPHKLSTLSADAHSDDIHSDDIAVGRFAALMKARLAAARAKGHGGWDDPAQCSTDYLRKLLHEHVAKGDPVDVANFCMMLAHYGASTAFSTDAIRQGEGVDHWKDMGLAPRHDGAKIIGYDAKWGVAEMMLDGAKRWVLAAFNGQVIYCNPLKWQPLASTPASHASDGGEA